MSAEYQPRTAERLIEILRAQDPNPRSWQQESADTMLRILTGLNVIAQAGDLHGGVWCVAQAIGYRDDLDFDQYPETGKAPVETQ